MKELVKRVLKKRTQETEETINATYYVVQFDYRYPLDLFGVVTLNYYGSTAKVIDQYLRLGWAFKDRKQADELARELNNDIRKKVKSWN